ncbi:hypothetical protein C8Q76DRAFT_691336 [Earliella scabrosa]|nr:hypothetical protein C8Q76DRAFT_691336 [Earliella scabrosa]
MSGDTEATQIIAEAASDTSTLVGFSQVIFYMNAVSGALLAYEYLITFDREVSLFWVQKITMASVLFMVNRYIALCAGMIGLPIEVTSQPHSGHLSCREAFNYIDAVFEISQYIPWAETTLRRAVLSQSSRWIFYTMAIVSRSTLVSADLLVLAITWKATFKASRDDIRAFGQRTSLSAILFRDGGMVKPLPKDSEFRRFEVYITQLGRILTSRNIMDSLTAILMSRFLIDLQEANNAILHQGSITSMGTSAFNRFIGSLGTPLPAPNFASESASVYEHEGQPEGHSGGGREAVAASPVE